jgi:hypothetical protein
MRNFIEDSYQSATQNSLVRQSIADLKNSLSSLNYHTKISYHISEEERSIDNKRINIAKAQRSLAAIAIQQRKKITMLKCANILL